MLCKELAEILLRTPDLKAEAVIPGGAFENDISEFEITSVLPGAGSVLLGGEDLDVDDDDCDEEIEDTAADEPEEGDYIIADARGGGEGVSQYHHFYGPFEDRDAAEQFIREHAAESKFWPSVWWQSDHGNNHRVEFDWKGYR